MGGSLAPQTDDPEFVSNPRHEFNFWFDPEAAQIVLRAPWKKIVCTPTDISVKTRLTPGHDQADRLQRNSAGAITLPGITRPARAANICGMNSQPPPGSIPR